LSRHNVLAHLCNYSDTKCSNTAHYVRPCRNSFAINGHPKKTPTAGKYLYDVIMNFVMSWEKSHTTVLCFLNVWPGVPSPLLRVSRSEEDARMGAQPHAQCYLCGIILKRRELIEWKPWLMLCCIWLSGIANRLLKGKVEIIVHKSNVLYPRERSGHLYIICTCCIRVRNLACRQDISKEHFSGYCGQANAISPHGKNELKTREERYPWYSLITRYLELQFGNIRDIG